MGRLDERVALVTGGGTNIGRAVALEFAREGASVAVAGRREAPLRETAELIAGQGGQSVVVVVDVTRADDVSRLIDTVVASCGRLDVAFNNAGTVGKPAPTAELDDQVFADVLAVNTTGVWLSMKHEIAWMRHHGGGTIVNCASNIGMHGRRPGMGLYAASKAAVSVLSATAAREYIAEGVRINAVSPGATDTPLSYRSGEDRAARDERVSAAVPIGRVASTQEIANAVLWLASDESSYVVGHDLVVDGGTTA